MQKLQGLYVIADAECIGKDNIVAKTQEVLSAGVKIIQYRDKVNTLTSKTEIAKQLHKLTNTYQSLLVINDDVNLAKSINADGVHLGKDDISIEKARIILGKDKIIGASCYADFNNVKPAIQASANYIAFGRFFDSTIKPQAPKADTTLIKQAKSEFAMPICAIGGITPKNAGTVLNAGADMIAVISGVFNSSSTQQAVQEYLSLF